MKTCGMVMTKDPTCCLANETVDKAALSMKNEDVGSIPVVDSHESKKLVGIVTDRDLVMNVMAEGRDPRTTRIGDVMSRQLVTCRESDDLNNAMNAMASPQVRRIPVVGSYDRLVGIIAQADVATQSENRQKTGEVVEGISKPSKAEAR